ncbi:MAG TPA: 16S rRNA (guanine(527)-N(7))-methyltransferase RsmG, partial [Limnochorda sp.]
MAATKDEIAFLVEEAARLGVELSERQAEQLIALTDRLLAAAELTSLTAIRERHEVLVKHHLDSLSLCRWIDAGAGERLADVGSGAGFPGLPLAVARPRLEVVLIESVWRKARFLEACVEDLGLSNVRVVRERAEVLGRQAEWRERFDYAAIRTVESPVKRLTWV